MSRLRLSPLTLTLSLALAVGLAGCDTMADAPATAVSPTAAAAPGGPGGGGCTSGVITGPSSLAGGASANYGVNMGPGCFISNVSWSVSNGASPSSTSSNPTTITAGSQTFTITASVDYGEGEWTSLTKTVNVGVQMSTSDPNGTSILVSWSGVPSNADQCTLTRTARHYSGSTTSTDFPVNCNASGSFTDTSYRFAYYYGDYSIDYDFVAEDLVNFNDFVVVGSASTNVDDADAN